MKSLKIFLFRKWKLAKLKKKTQKSQIPNTVCSWLKPIGVIYRIMNDTWKPIFIDLFLFGRQANNSYSNLDSWGSRNDIENGLQNENISISIIDVVANKRIFKVRSIWKNKIFKF